MDVLKIKRPGMVQVLARLSYITGDLKVRSSSSKGGWVDGEKAEGSRVFMNLKRDAGNRCGDEDRKM